MSHPTEPDVPSDVDRELPVAALTPEEAVQALDAAGGWPDPDLFRAVLAFGRDAVPAMLSHLARSVSDPESAFAVEAVEMIAEIADPSVIPGIVAYFRNADDGMIEVLEAGLPYLGPAVVPALLPIIQDRSLDWYPRAMATVTAVEASGHDPAARELVTAAIRDELQHYLNGAEELAGRTDAAAEDLRGLVASLCVHIAETHDEAARPLISAAYRAGIASRFTASEEDIDDIYEDPLSVNTYERGTFLERYEKKRESWLRFEEQRARFQNNPDYPSDPVPPKPVVTYVAPPQPGRNDPCWCGSGKKYKKCHLGQTDDKFA